MLHGLPNPQNISQYLYANQNVLTATPVSALNTIDLSADYKINGSPTTYKWFTEENGSLTPTSLTDRGNGYFTTDGSHANKTLVCKMSNVTFPDLESIYKIEIKPGASAYFENDKEALRRFLRQPSAESGKLNLEQLGLNISDTLTWYTSEEWVEKMPGLEWYNYGEFLKSINFNNRKLAGSLDCSLFINLMELNCANNQLSSIKFANSSLTDLNCANNQLTNLNIKSCTYLTNLYCSNNQLTSLNLKSIWLTTLACNDNKLTSLDVKNCIRLSEIWCGNNLLENLHFTGCTNLNQVNCSNNQLTSLNTTGCTKLSILLCQNNKLTDLMIKDCTNLHELYCSNNKLTSLNFVDYPQLFVLLCDNNELTSLDVINCPQLYALYCHNNKLTSLKIQGTSKLYDLKCNNNNLETLELGGGSRLMSVSCQNNKLSSISYNNIYQNFEFFNCSNNCLEFWDLPYKMDMKGEYLYLNQCYENEFTCQLLGTICFTDYFSNPHTIYSAFYIEEDGVLKKVELKERLRANTSNCFIVDERFANKTLIIKEESSDFPGLEYFYYYKITDNLTLRQTDETANELLDDTKPAIYPTIVGKGETIYIRTNDLATVEVYSISGRKVGSNKNVNLITAPSTSGNYIVRINVNGKVETHKITVK